MDIEDAIQQVSSVEGLEARDAIIGRALIRNRLLDSQTVLDAARAIAGELRP